MGRWSTIGWGLAFIALATIFRSDEGSFVVLALGVAGITSGGLLGIVNKRARAVDANIAFVVAVAINALFVGMERYVIGEVWVAWQWYPLLGAIVTFAVGGMLSLRHKGRAPVEPISVDGS